MHTWITAWLLVLFTAGSAGAESAGHGHLTGQVMMEGKSMPSANIAIFVVGNGPPPDLGSSRRVPEGIFRAEKGRFKISLPPGRYYMGVAARLDSNRKGPPGADESFFFVRDQHGELRQFSVTGGETVDLGQLSGSASEAFPEIADSFTVEGTIYDEQGTPLQGALVLVRGNPAIPRPLFLSSRTGVDGRYQLKLPAGNSYYLVVRESLADVGRPVKGSHVGAYVRDSGSAEKGSPVLSAGDPITGSAGQVLKGMDITMRSVPDPEETKEAVQKKQSESPMTPEKVGEMPLPLVPQEKVWEMPLLSPGVP